MDQNTNAIAGVEAQREETVNAPALADSTGSTDKAMKTRQRLTSSQKADAEKLRSLQLTDGEARDVYLCIECGTVQAHDYIPYGLGRGCWYNQCHCNAVSGNWIYRAQLIKP